MVYQRREMSIMDVPPHPRGRAVLLVEDEEPLRTILSRSIQQRGYSLAAVDSVGAAIAQMMTHIPDVIVLDINLPDGTGWEILRWLRAVDQWPAVIVCSALPPSPKRVAEFHPDAILTKPFPMDCLLDLVATVGLRERTLPAVESRS